MGDLSDAELCAELLLNNFITPDSDTESDNEVEEIPTYATAMQSLENLRKYLEAKGPENYNALYNLIAEVRHCHSKTSTPVLSKLFLFTAH